jgi:aryl-alcohol dehydrogenase-like predicted oxidoreductase
MSRKKLGHSDLEVSQICLGTMTFGEQNSEREAHEQLDVAAARGVNFIDTAEMYPVPPRPETQGRTESIVGTWLQKQDRSRFIVATKIAGPRRPIHWVRDGKLKITRAGVASAVETSLARLKTDYIDLYQIHWPDRYVPQFGEHAYDPSQETPDPTPVLEQLEALDAVVKAGKVRYIGLSNETPWGVLEFVRLAEKHGLPRPVSIQNAYSLLNRTFDSALAEVTRHERVELLAYSALAFGFLTGKHLTGPAPGSRVAKFDGFAFRYRKQNVDEAVREYVELSRELGISPATLALAFAKSRFFVGSTIIGATTRAQLDENLAAFDVTLSPDALARIDAIHARYPNPAP